MSPPLLWINKTPNSSVLSRSSRRDESRIRRHVQTEWKASNSTPGSTVTPSDRAVEDGGLADRKSASAKGLIVERVVTSLSRIQTTSRRPSQRRNASRGRKPKQLRAFQTVPRFLVAAWRDLSPAARRSLYFFELRTSREWAGWSDANFWGTLALQASQRSTAVAHSLISLSALHESLETADDFHKRRLHCLGFVEIQTSVQSLIGTNLSYFEALVSCLALLCFQNLQQSRKSFLLLQAGINMLKEYDDNAASPKRLSTSTEEAEAIETSIRPLLERLYCRPCRMGDPSMAFLISVQRQRIVCCLAPDIVKPKIAATFANLIGARNSLESILQWAQSSIPIDQGLGRARRSFQRHFRLLREVWEAALACSLTEGSVNEPTSARSKALLQVSCLFAMIIIETAGTQDELIYDQYLEHFRKIIQLVEQSHPSHHAVTNDISFGIDNGLVDIVTFVGTKCRDPSVRRRALSLLLLGNRIEGDRLACIPGEILRVQIELEEDGIDVRSCRDVPESSRRRLLRGHQVFATGRIELFFTVRPYDLNLGAIEEQYSISLPGPTEDVPCSEHHSGRPDAIFGSGYAQFLEDRQNGRYFRLDLEKFFFPIPRS